MTEIDNSVPVNVIGVPDDDAPSSTAGDRPGVSGTGPVVAQGIPEASSGRPVRRTGRPAGARLIPRHRRHELSDPWRAYADLFDSGSEFRLVLEVPGVSKERLNINLTSNDITVECRPQSDRREAGFARRRSYEGRSKILRGLTFPEEVMAEKAEANLNNGVLEVRIPKKTPTQVSKHRVVVR
ncbi:MAG: Hsp20/alpha crystallin family protein [Nitrososphaerales archaeon]|jgi:HSP20 family molecular chaperone IbpA